MSTQNSNNQHKPVVSTGLNITIMIATVIFPVVGLLMGFAYLRKDHPDAKKMGKVWLIFGVVMVVANIVLISMMRQQPST
ncbi:hypothetical protein W03_13340 [Nitrosomonas sp. PY1]|uniref:hypothetical protein n=1 Tax=Nitrosomonas sp. PY1 TaxID=1803906 RepID=UPI001FC860CA|nr:hypothetical protein [Nitrosomonas sp. PY1]GKS69330.1 hypothetical protein W03_13340 [Nitrosomonas sp. PY1]